MTKWLQDLKARLAENPLRYTGDVHKPVMCVKCGAKGRRVPLYAVTNYGNEFNHCYVCGYKP